MNFQKQLDQLLLLLLIQKISSVNDPLNVITFNPEFGTDVNRTVQKSGSDGLLIDPSLAKQMIKSIIDVGEKSSVNGDSLVVVTSPIIRK